MKAVWKLQDAKSQLSKVIENAVTDGPQFVTKRGIETVVVLSAKKYEDLTSHKPSFIEFLLHCPKPDEPLNLERQKDFPRSIDL